jgi:hypothetical protein
VWNRCLNVNKIAYTHDDNDDGRAASPKVAKSNGTVFTKRDVRSLFSKFFKKDTDVPLKLLIKIDNYFMIFVHYFVQYLRDTGLMYNKHITLVHMTCFLKMYNHHVWPRYYGRLLDINIRSKIYMDLLDCVKKQHKQYCNFENDQFKIDLSVIHVLVDFAFDVLLWILGPVLIQNGKTVCISATSCPNLFIRHIEIFKMKYVLLNKKIPCLLNLSTVVV